MSYEEIRYGVEDRVATITLDRPERMNAFTPRMCGEMLRALDAADADDEVRAVVVTGTGRAFCAGADLGVGITMTLPMDVRIVARQMLWRMMGATSPLEAHRIDSKCIFWMGRSPDAYEGVSAFLEKRPARFAMRPSTDMPPFYPWWGE